MERRKVLLVYPEFPLSYWGFQYSLRIFGKKAMHPPLSLITAAALCPREWEYRLIDLNIETLSDEDIRWADMVFLTAMGIQTKSLYEVVERCKQLGRKTVLGGPWASGSPDRSIGLADVCVLDEAEITMLPFLEDLEKGTLKNVYRTDKKPDVSISPCPRYDLLKLDKYSVIDVQYSRGCPFNCEFCDIIELYGRVPRTKTPDQIKVEFQTLYDLGYRGPIFLVDDNFIGNKKNVRVLLKELVPWQQKHEYPFFLTTEASVNLAEDEKLLEDMRLAGFKRVFVGIETPSLESLKETQKYQNTRKPLVEAVQTLIDHGLEVSGGFIVGFDNDEADIFERQIEFIEQAEIPWAMVGTLTAIPSTQLWRRLEKEGRILGFADGDQFGRPNFKTKMDPEVLYKGYLRLLEHLYKPENYYKRVLSVLARHDKANHPNLHEKNYPLIKVIFLTLMSVIALGIKAEYRQHFWSYLATVIRKHPKRYVQALINAVIGHHFIKYTKEVMTRQRALKPHVANAPLAARVAGAPLPMVPPKAAGAAVEARSDVA
jgi:radical SAM superfamily enzyme YgiQ (UPF0313 family)